MSTSPTTAAASVPAPVSRSAHRLATRALGWLRRHCELGTLPPGTTAEMADPDSVYKPLGETALAASLVLREGLASRKETETARELLDFAWWELRGGDMLYERQLRYMMMADPLELYAHFVRAGYRHPRMDALVAHLRSLTSTRAAEQVPNRRLAVANAARLVGLGGDVDWRRLTDDTWLGNTPEPWAIDWMTAYCVTHSVFHITDWGGRPGELPEPVEEYLRLWLPVWLDVWREIQEWDLVAELMIVGSCLNEPYFDAGLWEELAATQHEDGLVPRDGKPVEGDTAQRFREHHHTTVVAAVAGTLALSRAGVGRTR
ncbi:hypothetical protein F0L17_14765 [Streptomyces sp. TRM43335]|uniref:DUF6895 domain-containing protein n=1 Tax=Streptomyces taklimakanensis TaxID=2569853 RepID=A0A6G2BDY9_9ACTN|nr:hypothetical protein [Streptomyces taklimakanensis]MTE20346.1 hypothetical protein [Streptomyces taklimakanensis]